MPSHATVDARLELDLNPQWREPVTSRRLLRAGVGSVLVHVAIIALLVSLPAVETSPDATVITPDVSRAVPLVAPRFYEPTQKDPNKGKVSRELDVRSSETAPEPRAPRFKVPQPAPGPVAQATPPAPSPAPKIEQPRIEPPRILAAAAPPPPPPTVNANPPAVAPPLAPPKPKLAFESIGSGQTQVAANPNSVVPDPRSRLLNTGPNPPPGGGGTMVGDIGDSAATIPNLNQSPSAGRIGSNLQLLSDAKGVDFKPYLIQVLTAVRRNWLAILPDSARLGQRGRVLVQFAIDRSGSVPKLVIAEGAGVNALDRAAVAAISASYPFPPLPTDYKGDQIRLQLAFSYNMPTR